THRPGVSRCAAPPRSRYTARVPVPPRRTQPAGRRVLPAHGIPESLQPARRHRRLVVARRSFRTALLAVSPVQYFEPDACLTLLDEPENVRGLARQVDDDAVGSLSQIASASC